MGKQVARESVFSAELPGFRVPRCDNPAFNSR